LKKPAISRHEWKLVRGRLHDCDSCALRQ